MRLAALGVAMAIAGVSAAMASAPRISASAKYHDTPVCVEVGADARRNPTVTVAGATGGCDCRPGSARMACLKEIKVEIAPVASEIGGRSYLFIVAERDDGAGAALDRNGQWIDRLKAPALEYSFVFEPVASRHTVSLPLPSRETLGQFCAPSPDGRPRRVDLYAGYGAVDPRLMKTAENRGALAQDIPAAHVGNRHADMKAATENGYLASARADAYRDRANRIVKVLSLSC